MAPEDLLDRLGATVRGDIAPAVEAGYRRTQAYMAAVVLEKLALEVRLAPAHAAADADDARRLVDDLAPRLAAGPPAVADALGALRDGPGAAALSRLVEALYASRDALGEPAFADALARLRGALRASIDRRMEVAR
jgi:hypothetical protein